MRKHLLLFFSALLFVVACNSDKPDGNIIDQDKMVLILSDIHLVDGSLMIHGANDSLYKYGTNRYGLVFKKYGIDSALFNNSLKYYSGDPEEMIKIYDNVGKVLAAKNDSTSKVQAKQTALEVKRHEAKVKAEQKRKADSIKRDSAQRIKALQLKTNRKLL